MSEKDELKLVEDFIYNDKVQNILSQINSNVMDFNILEITGMGTQEIKHSKILGWLFDDSQHNLEYQILDGFLKKVVQEKDNECNELHEYIYLANKKRDITVYREKDKQGGRLAPLIHIVPIIPISHIKISNGMRTNCLL